jgi:leader peptidase (prepilin peptidase)/N-methyltransferase
MSPAFPLALITLFGCALAVIVVALAVVDWRQMILPNWLNFVLMGTGIAQGILVGRPDLIDGTLGALAGAGSLGLLTSIFRWVRGIDGLGLGDQKFVAGAGFWTGWQELMLMLLVASTSALVFVAVRSARARKLDAGLRLPFGPFLGLGTCVAWITGLAG